MDVYGHFVNDSTSCAHPGEVKTKQGESEVGGGRSNAYVCCMTARQVGVG